MCASFSAWRRGSACIERNHSSRSLSRGTSTFLPSRSRPVVCLVESRQQHRQLQIHVKQAVGLRHEQTPSSPIFPPVSVFDSSLPCESNWKGIPTSTPDTRVPASELQHLPNQEYVRTIQAYALELLLSTLSSSANNSKLVSQSTTRRKNAARWKGACLIRYYTATQIFCSIYKVSLYTLQEIDLLVQLPKQILWEPVCQYNCQAFHLEAPILVALPVGCSVRICE
jgi:hypothetical protein